MSTATILANQMDLTRDWTLKLLADVAGDDWSYQPGPGLAHILWACGHLAVSQNVLIHIRCLGKSIIDDAFAAHFPMGGAIQSTSEHDYPEPQRVLQAMADMHARTLAAVRGMSDALLAEPCGGKDGAPHPHYTDKLGAVTHCFRHEAYHAGQIGLIRRLRGKAFLR